MPNARICALCGAPLPPRAKAYCLACRLERAKQLAAEAQRRRRQKERAARAEQKAAAVKKRLEQQRTARPGGWTDADVTRCVGCKYWRPLGYYGRACYYSIDTGRLRPCRPRECYGHAGTPYTPKK